MYSNSTKSGKLTPSRCAPLPPQSFRATTSDAPILLWRGVRWVALYWAGQGTDHRPFPIQMTGVPIQLTEDPFSLTRSQLRGMDRMDCTLCTNRPWTHDFTGPRVAPCGSESVYLSNMCVHTVLVG